MYIQSLDGLLKEKESGSKAYHLSVMKRAGFPVPGGFVIKTKAFDQFQLNKNGIDGPLKIELQNELNKLSALKFMVRSSAVGEDGASSSFAGQLDSFQATGNIEDIISKVLLCWDSYNKYSLNIYQNTSNAKLDGMAVIVQELIDPDYAGVIFTRSPHDENKMLVEYVNGHGEQLVSGRVNPEFFTFSHTDQSTSGHLPFKFDEGIQAAKKLERMYSVSLDIEWAMKNGKFYLLQSRPITSYSKSRIIQWSNTNVNENYPDAITPLLYSIARDSYYNYFKNLSNLFLIPETTIQSLEGAYSNVIAVHGCKMYYNMSSIHEIISASPFSKILVKSFDNFVGYTQETKDANPLNSGSKFRFILKAFRFNHSLEDTVREFEKRAEKYRADTNKAISFEELIQCFHQFIEIRMHSWHKASLADFFAMLYHGILGKFCAKYYPDNHEGIHNQLIQAIPGLISSEPIKLMYQIKLELRNNKSIYDKFRATNSAEFYEWLKSEYNDLKVTALIQKYLSDFGFRCSGELMLTASNYIDEPHKFIDLLKQYDELPDINPQQLILEKNKAREKTISEFRNLIWQKNGINIFKSVFHSLLLNTLIRLSCKGIAARERVRLKQASLYYQFKTILSKCGDELNKRNLLSDAKDLLYLRYQELSELMNSSFMLKNAISDNIEINKTHFNKTSQLNYPDDFYSHLGEYPLPEELPDKVNQSQSTSLSGLSACGGKVKARVKVLDSVLEANKLEIGDILVTRQTDPGWVVVFPIISGLIVERGGMLSHGAIVSREFGIPAIVGVQGACQMLNDNDMVILNAYTGEITIVNE